MVLATWLRLSLVTFLHSTIILCGFFVIISHLVFSLRRRNNLVFFLLSLKVFDTCRYIPDTTFLAVVRHILLILVLFLFPFFITNSEWIFENKSNTSVFLNFKENCGIKYFAGLFLILSSQRTNNR